MNGIGKFRLEKISSVLENCVVLKINSEFCQFLSVLWPKNPVLASITSRNLMNKKATLINRGKAMVSERVGENSIPVVEII